MTPFRFFLEKNLIARNIIFFTKTVLYKYLFETKNTQYMVLLSVKNWGERIYALKEEQQNNKGKRKEDKINF